LKKAIGYFEQAIEKDPKYAAPYAGIADSYNLLAFYGYMFAHDAIPKAREYAQKAIEIDNTKAEAHCALGFIHQYYDWNCIKAEQKYMRAIDLNPAYTPAHYWYSSTLLAMGRIDDAIHENEQSITLDPHSVQAYTVFGWNLIGMRQFEQSVEMLEWALELNPDFVLAHWLLGCSYYLLSRQQEALTEFRKTVSLSDRNPWMLSTIGSVYARLGRTLEARKILAELADRSQHECVQAFYIAYLYLGLGDVDEALTWLEKSFEARDSYLIIPAMVAEFTFDEYENDLRIQAFLEKVRCEVVT
jgi:tetratricopeptide (TPR) repeat protein